MTRIRVGFSGGDNLLDKAINAVSGSQYVNISHAFIYILGSVLESEGVKEESDPYPGVWLHMPDKYDAAEYVRIVGIDIPDMWAAEKKARELLGTAYGYIDCLTTAAKFLTGHNIVKDSEGTMHCSETVTRILRAGGIDVCPDLEPGEVSPVLLYQDLINKGGDEE